MIGEFVTTTLILVLGYAYPALQCFKTLEKNRVDIHELRFWCQYWIIIAVLTILERIGDTFISWLPMYGEVKLALFIFLWYPNTKGTGFVYENLLRPYVSKHEIDIERSLWEFRERAWNLAIYFWQNCTELSSTKILQFFQFVTSQSAKITESTFQNTEGQHSMEAPPPSMLTRIFSRNRPNKQRPHPIPPPPAAYHTHTPISESMQPHLHHQSHLIRPEDSLIPDLGINNGFEHNFNLRARHSKGGY
ncbi:putative HVA22-like protein g [Primulina eburnea]|uniref:putative HVA22-like protein g n=1 Tax=Primulina eburnea TaxID=1245227 RepID=UPI003C6C0B51